MFALFLMFINHHQPSIALDPQNGHISVELLSRQATSSSAQSQLLWAINGLWRRNSWKSQCLFGRFLSQVSRIAGCSNGQASQNWLRRGKLTGHPHIWLVKYIKIPCFPCVEVSFPSQVRVSSKIHGSWPKMAQDGPRWANGTVLKLLQLEALQKQVRMCIEPPKKHGDGTWDHDWPWVFVPSMRNFGGWHPK